MARQLTFAQEPTFLKIRELPPEDQPASRLAQVGPGALSNIELLALVVGSDDGLIHAANLLLAFGNLPVLAGAAVSQIAAQPGMNFNRAVRLKAAFELSKRALYHRDGDLPQIKSPADAANLLFDLRHQDHEELWVLVLNTRNFVVATEMLYKGNVNTSIVRPAEVFKTAVKLNAPAIIIAHNHPSNDPTPSPEDVHITKQLYGLGKDLGIDVLDHLIMAADRYISLKERGLGFS